MPLVHVHVHEGRTVAEKKAILEGVHAALVDAFKVPVTDRHQFLHEHSSDHFESNRGPAFTLVEITVLPGRSDAAKKMLYQTIVANLESDPGIERTNVLIVLHEPPLENWGVKGGVIGTEADFGFDLNV